MIRDILLWAVAPFAAVVGVPLAAAEYDKQDTRLEYSTDWTFSGNKVVVERRIGNRIGIYSSSRIVGYFIAGRPRLVAFGCEGREPDAVLIAMEEDELPRCKRIEPIRY